MNDTPLRLTGAPEILRVGGTAYEAGLTHGEAYAPLIRYTWRKVRTKFFGWDIEQLRARLDFLIAETGKRFPDEIEEIRGIADGAGLDFRQAFVINRHLGGAVACTAMGVTHSDHGPVAGANLDDDALYFMKDSSVAGQYRYIVTTWPGTLGGGNGLNEHGLAFCGSSAAFKFTEPGPKPDYITDNFSIATRVLRSCKTVEEGIALITRPDIGGHCNHVMVDASGKAACVEKRWHSHLATRYPDEKGFIFSINYFMSEYNTPERMEQMEERSVDRLATIQRRHPELDGRNGFEFIQSLLRDTTVKSTDWPISNHRTILGSVMLPREARILISDGPPHLGEFVSHSLR